MPSQDQIKGPAAAMPRMGRAQRSNTVPMLATVEPVVQLGADTTAAFAALAGDDEEQAVAACIGPVEGFGEQRMGGGEGIAVQIDDAVGADVALPQSAVPTAVERGGGNCRAGGLAQWPGRRA